MLKFLGALALALVVFISAENALDSFQSCIGHEANQQSAQDSKNKNYVTAGFSFVGRQSLCSVRLVDAHSGFFAAVAAFVIAWFTFTLKQSTDRLWKVGQDDLETTERAFVFIDGFNPEITTAADVKVPNIENLPLRYRDIPGLYLTRFAIQPRWKNSGNTPTRHMKIQTSWRGPPGPIPPNYDYQNIPKPFFLAPKATEASGFIEMNQAAQLIDWGLNPIGDPPMFFIWGRADYEDVFNAPHFVEWCYEVRFERHDGKILRAGFIQWGDYNRTDEDSHT